MKTFFIILILFIKTPQVKQYQIYEAEEGKVNYLVRGQMAITKEVVYLKLDSTIYTFKIQKNMDFKGKSFYFVGYDTLYNGDKYSLYRGVIVVIPNGTNEKTKREQGNIFVECRTIRSERRVIYKYK